MKKWRNILILFFLIIFATGLLYAGDLQPKLIDKSAVDTSNNLLLNPGFEEPNEKIEWPDHWILEKNGGYGPNETLDAEYVYGEAHTGKYCVKISTSNPNHTTIIFPVHPETEFCFAVKGFKKVKISGWMKTEDVVPGNETWMRASIGLWCFKKNNLEPAGSFSMNGPKGTADWTYFEKEFGLPEEAKYIRLWLSNLHSTGTIWFDDVSLVPVREP